MSRLRKLSRSGWALVGLVVGLMLAPAAVFAATTLVQIVGTNGTTKAQVNAANQLLTAESAPASNVVVGGQPGPENTCHPFYTVPTGKALIIKTATFFLTPRDVPSVDIYLFTGPAATPCSRVVDLGVATEKSSESHSYGPGIVVKSGQKVAAHGTEDNPGLVFIYGYLVPAAAAP